MRPIEVQTKNSQDWQLTVSKLAGELNNNCRTDRNNLVGDLGIKRLCANIGHVIVPSM